MSAKLNIEELINAKLGSAEVKPSNSAWRKVRRKLRRAEFMRFRPSRPNIYYTAVAVIVAGTLIAVFTTEPEEADNLKPITPQEKVQPGSTKVESVEKDRFPQEEISEIEKKALADPEADLHTIDTISQTGKETLQEPVKDEKKIQTGEKPGPEYSVEKSEDPDDIVQVSEFKSLITYFTTSKESGCAPLIVEFHSQCANADTYSWVFGNGQTSMAPHPVIIFEEPGIYTVSLTAGCATGEISTHQQTVEVYPAPTADFDIETGIEGFENAAILNYSTGASRYSWELINPSEPLMRTVISKEFQPVIDDFEKQFSANTLRLIATNEYGCSDTLSRVLPPIYNADRYFLIFPTAFSPNLTGPTGGYYNLSDSKNEIFHPKFKEEPVVYNLRIYNRAGEILFESNDLYKGWDGYYQQRSVATGVYIWRANGRWKNGETFELQGDVTLLWKQ